MIAGGFTISTFCGCFCGRTFSDWLYSKDVFWSTLYQVMASEWSFKLWLIIVGNGTRLLINQLLMMSHDWHMEMTLAISVFPVEMSALHWFQMSGDMQLICCRIIFQASYKDYVNKLLLSLTVIPGILLTCIYNYSERTVLMIQFTCPVISNLFFFFFPPHSGAIQKVYDIFHNLLTHRLESI